jgi:hypothetical protein
MKLPVITDRELSDVFIGTAKTAQDLANPAPEKNPTLRERNTKHNPKEAFKTHSRTNGAQSPITANSS